MAFRFLRQSLVTASVITIGANILSRLLGYVREATIANYFGTSQIFDIFILAFTIPELIASVIFTSLPPAFLPVLKKIPGRADNRDSEAFWSGTISLVILFAAISMLILTFRGPILSWLAPQLAADQFLKGKRLLAILSLFIFFRGSESYFRSWLYEKKHFIVPALSSVLMNVVILAVLFIFYKKIDIEALAFGWLAASLILFVSDFIFAFHIICPGARPRVSGRWVRILLSSLLAIAILESISMVFPMIDRYLAARWLGPGQIAALRYASILIQIPVGIFVASYNVVALPWITDYSVPGKSEELRKIYSESTGLILFAIGFIALASMMFSDDIVRLAFQRGAFDVNSQKLTSGPFKFYSMGIVFHSLYIFQMRFYYAKSLLGRLGVILLIRLVLKVALSLILIGPLEHNGLALATSISWLCFFLMLSIDLRLKMGMPVRYLLLNMFFRIAPALIVIALFWATLSKLWQCGASTSSYELVLRFLFLVCSGAALYLTLGFLMKLPQPGLMLRILTRSFRGRGTRNC